MRKWLAVVCLCGSVAMSGAELATRKALTLQAVKAIASAAEAEAVKNEWKVVIAIVDDGGHLLYLQRMDDVQIASLEIAQQKALTAVKFRRPSKAFEEQLVGGRMAVLKIPGALPVEGGVPIMVDGKVIGAIGVSGVTSQQDGQIARAGAEAVGK